MNITDFQGLAPYDPFRPSFYPSEQQAAIFECGLQRNSHIRVIARAGTGKTTTSMEFIGQLVEHIGRNIKIVVIQFNKSIQAEAQAKLVERGLDDCAIARTFHSIGNASLYNAFGSLPINEYKTDRMLPANLPEAVKQSVPRFVSLCKNNLVMPEELGVDRLESMAFEFDIDIEGFETQIQNLVAGVLRRGIEEKPTEIDFDDMIWLPIVKNLAVRRADLLVVDESQDLNEAQRQLSLKILGKNGRLMFIGDPKQAIYAFRGASHTSMDDLAELLQDSTRGLETFPLTVTRRCPKKVVELAQQLVPDFVAHEDAPDGEVRVAQLHEQPEHGDLVLCRINAPLVNMAYDLIRRNIPARIQGRDIGTGLKRLIEKLAKPFDDVEDLLDKLSEYEDKERSKILKRGKNIERKLATLEDKCQCIEACCSGLDTVQEVLNRISNLFANIDASADHSTYVLLSSVHKAKGMESDTVRILHPELMPHPMAKGASREQEYNIAYVAVTRAKKTLIFHGDPHIFSLPEEPVQQPEEVLDSEVAASTDVSDERADLQPARVLNMEDGQEYHSAIWAFSERYQRTWEEQEDDWSTTVHTQTLGRIDGATLCGQRLPIKRKVYQGINPLPAVNCATCTERMLTEANTPELDD